MICMDINPFVSLRLWSAYEDMHRWPHLLMTIHLQKCLVKADVSLVHELV